MKEDIFHLGIKAIIRNSDGKILLLKTNSKALKHYKGDPYWDIPGGRIHIGSTIKETLKREVEEETGIREIRGFRLFLIVLSNIRIPVGDSTVGLILSSYICDVDKINNVKLSEEHTEYGWFEPREASKLLKVKYPNEFISKIAQLD